MTLADDREFINRLYAAEGRTNPWTVGAVLNHKAKGGQRVKQSNDEIAAEFIEACRNTGFRYNTHEGIVTVTKVIPVDDRDEFVNADGVAPQLLGIIPRSRPGTTWGTDGGSVGGMEALRTGQFRLNKSGCNLNVIRSITKHTHGDS